MKNGITEFDQINGMDFSLRFSRLPKAEAKVNLHRPMPPHFFMRPHFLILANSGYASTIVAGNSYLDGTGNLVLGVRRGGFPATDGTTTSYSDAASAGMGQRFYKVQVGP